MKGIADSLEAIGQPVSEYDLYNQILNGLGPEYGSIHTSIANRETPISFEELFGQLLTFELRLELHASAITPPATALYTNNSGGRTGQRGRGRGRGRNSNSKEGSFTQTNSHQIQGLRLPHVRSAIV